MVQQAERIMGIAHGVLWRVWIVGIVVIGWFVVAKVPQEVYSVQLGVWYPNTTFHNAATFWAQWILSGLIIPCVRWRR